MTRDDMQRLKALGLSASRFARAVGLNPITVMYWGRRRHERDLQKAPAWVDRLIAAWEAHPELIPPDTR